MKVKTSPDSKDLSATTLARGGFGGLLMGLANLVPGLSGGTMLLAVGIYPQFIGAIAEVSKFRFRAKTLLLLGSVIGVAVIAIALLARQVKYLVIYHHWIMYSLFIGLTLGGVPILLRMLKPIGASAILGAIAGFIAMVLLALAQSSGVASEPSSDTAAVAMLVIAGIAGGAAMILPGVSGGYLLLVLGQYIVILGAIETARAAVSDQNWSQLSEAARIIIPVGIGVVVGVVGVSNLIKFLLDRYPKATLGVLLGLLLGAVVGLWPFQQPAAPEVGDYIKGRLITEENKSSIDKEDWRTERFSPKASQIAGCLGLILVGLAASTAVARIGASTGKENSS
ncbi:MAG: DUF368 domain-containing protein [Planctomycetes bacterium]|nr:DUF368 domain-containing protein [Planctomycetota bacterium]